MADLAVQRMSGEETGEYKMEMKTGETPSGKDALERGDIKNLDGRERVCGNISESEYEFALQEWRAMMASRKILQGRIKAYIDRYGFRLDKTPEDLVMR
jgi:hypothetical protein